MMIPKYRANELTLPTSPSFRAQRGISVTEDLLRAKIAAVAEFIPSASEGPARNGDLSVYSETEY